MDEDIKAKIKLYADSLFSNAGDLVKLLDAGALDTITGRLFNTFNYVEHDFEKLREIIDELE